MPSAACLFVVLICGGAGARVAQAVEKTESARPNLIVIMADDLGAKELSCYGHPRHRTPRLDELARTGIQFNTCYTACICHPTRFEIMTGQYGSTNKVYHFAGRAGGPDPRSPEEQIVNHLTFGKVLSDAGYATSQAGKWQLTGEHPQLVVETGFDEYCMWAYQHNLPPGVTHPGGYEDPGRTKTSRYWHPSIVRNGEYVPTTIDDYGPDIFNEFVIDFIRRHREGPFFVYYPMPLVHGPHYATPSSQPNAVDKFRNSKQDHFRENVEYMDLLVGRIVDALEELGLRDDTLVLFTGDNGTGGEGKGTATELGARVPMIINCPGRVVSTGLTDALCDTSDVFPTLVELAGASLPSGHLLDGRSLVPLLTGQQHDVREWAFSYLGDRRVLRTKRWLLEENSPTHYGTLFDCGDRRDGTGYRDVTESTDPEVLAVKRQFEEILLTKPVPEVGEGEEDAGRQGRRARRTQRSSRTD
jgi:arylsulfatase A